MVAPTSPPIPECAPSGFVPPNQRPKRGLRMLAVLFAGIYSWVLTVFPTVPSDGSEPGSAVAAWAALLVLVASPLLPPGRWAVIAALDVFLGLCILSWWLEGYLELRGVSLVFGSLGWLAYALALGSLSTPSSGPPLPSSAGPILAPRSAPRHLPLVVLLVTVGGAVTLLVAAWTVERETVAVLAHIIALSSALLLLRGGAQLSGHLHTLGTRLQRRLRMRSAVLPLLLLSSWIALGVLLRSFAP